MNFANNFLKNFAKRVDLKNIYIYNRCKKIVNYERGGRQ